MGGRALKVLIDALENPDVQPSPRLFNTFMGIAVRARDTHAAIDAFKDMKDCGVLPNASTYTMLIEGCRDSGSSALHTSAIEMFREMLDDEVPPTPAICEAVLSMSKSVGDSAAEALAKSTLSLIAEMISND